MAKRASKRRTAGKGGDRGGMDLARLLEPKRGATLLRFAGKDARGRRAMAIELARALDRELYRVDLAAVVSKYIGETEKNLRRIFDAAEISDAILFFDEADEVFGKRTNVKDAHDRYANLETSYLVQCLARHRGIAILATNRKTNLDPAFQRRLRATLSFDPPRRAKKPQRRVASRS
jgi:SpoVK/Ycf46/Vps4 family AAA+-type ATPase